MFAFRVEHSKMDHCLLCPSKLFFLLISIDCVFFGCATIIIIIMIISSENTSFDVKNGVRKQHLRKEGRGNKYLVARLTDIFKSNLLCEKHFVLTSQSQKLKRLLFCCNDARWEQSTNSSQNCDRNLQATLYFS